jgi:hypothetical protein
LPCQVPLDQQASCSRANQRLWQPKGIQTILRDRSTPTPDPAALALSALGWVLSDEDRADRLLALTGIFPEELRQRIGENEVLAAILDFVLQHEPDTLACAAALSVTPETLVAAHAKLAAPQGNVDWGA